LIISLGTPSPFALNASAMMLQFPGSRRRQQPPLPGQLDHIDLATAGRDHEAITLAVGSLADQRAMVSSGAPGRVAPQDAQDRRRGKAF
jgi:hypothetical protein